MHMLCMNMEATTVRMINIRLQCQHEFEIKFLSQPKIPLGVFIINNSVAYQS